MGLLIDQAWKEAWHASTAFRRHVGGRQCWVVVATHRAMAVNAIRAVIDKTSGYESQWQCWG